MNTRIAPSPTGYAHIGFARTAYLNYLAARSTGGNFYLRIDDTDRARSENKFMIDLILTLGKLGLMPDHMWMQSGHYDLYRDYAQRLLRDGHAKQMENGAVSLVLPEEQKITSWVDSISGEVQITEDKYKKDIQGLIILRGDGSPTYHFASVVDDIDRKIDWVIRGTDHIDNTAKHVYLYDVIGAPLPKFSHVGLIHYQGKKISKRDGISNMQYYFDNFTPDAILNAILKLGWSHPDPNFDKTYPLVDNETAIKLFPEGHLRAAKATLDLEKLKWLDKKYRAKNEKQTDTGTSGNR